MSKIILILLIILFFSCKNSGDKQSVLQSISTINNDSIPKDIALTKKSLISNPVKLIKILPDSIKIDYHKDSLFISKSMWVDSLELMVGKIDNNENGIHLFVKNSNNEILYQSKGKMDAWKYDLNFYKSKSFDGLILVNELSAEESWGVDIHKYDNGLYKEIGSLDLVALNEYDESTSIIPFLNITESKEDVLEFSFKKTCKIYDNELEETISGEEILYRFENNRLKLMAKF